MGSAHQKQAVRERIAALLKREPVLLQTDKPCSALLASEAYAHSRTVLAFVAMPDELSTDALLRDVITSKRRLVLPRASSRSAAMTLHQVGNLDADLERSRLGFRQPKKSLPCVAVNEIDLIVVPGVAFDERGYRLGRGAGHYDRLLCAPGIRATIVAMALDEQIIAGLPVEPHDRPVHTIFTPTRVISCRPIS